MERSRGHQEETRQPRPPKIPIRLVVVDSASTDNTVRLVEDWLAKRGSVFESHEVLKMPVRKGKTAAVVKALEHIGQHRDGLICMTAADALLEEGVLHRMMQWFADPMIGAVGALPNRQQARLEEREHRESWDGMRLAESMVDSTPFLEGSCMMWRPSCLAIDDLNVGSNADDAQIATSVRTRGWRTVVDTRARFVDAAPASIEEQRRQKVRRAQGLQRLLVQRRRRATARTQGIFAKIMRRQFHFHITAPLALTVACISAIMRWVFIALYGWPATFTLANSLHLGFTVAEILCVGLWWRSRSGKTTVRSHCSVDGFQAWSCWAVRCSPRPGAHRFTCGNSTRTCVMLLLSWKFKEKAPPTALAVGGALYRSWTWIDRYSVMKITQQGRRWWCRWSCLHGCP